MHAFKNNVAEMLFSVSYRCADCFEKPSPGKYMKRVKLESSCPVDVKTIAQLPNMCIYYK